VRNQLIIHLENEMDYHTSRMEYHAAERNRCWEQLHAHTSLYKIRDYHPKGYTEQPLEADCERLPDNPE